MSSGASLSTISEQEFRRLCDDIYEDRLRIYSFNPNAEQMEALLWMLLGCVVSLLSVPILDQPSVYGTTNADFYSEAVCALLRNRTSPPFDPRACLAELSEKLKAED